MLKSKTFWICALSALELLAASSAHAGLPAGLSAGWVSGSLETGIAHDVAPVAGFSTEDGRSLALSSERVRSSNHYQRDAGAANAAVSCGTALNCVANYSVDARTGTGSREFDMETTHGDFGLSRTWAGTVYGLRAGDEQWKIGGQSFGQMRSLTADAVRFEDAQVAAYGAVTVARLDHPGSYASLDSNYRALSGVLRHATTGGWQSSFSLQAVLSREDNRNRDRWLDSRGEVLRAVWEANPVERWEARAAITTQSLRYGDIDPSVGVQRSDRFNTFELNLARKLDNRLQLRLEYIAAHHSSSVQGPGNAWSSIGAALQWQLH